MTSGMRVVGLVLVLVCIASVLALVAGPATGSTARPSLRVLQLRPFEVRGRDFEAGEGVELVLLSPARASRRVRADSTGSFTATFGNVAVDRCRGFVVRAAGGLGSRATLKGGALQGGTGAEEAWLELLKEGGLRAGRRAVLVTVKRRSATELTVAVRLPAAAPREVTFPDALYGATAYAFERKRWRRVDTAEVRAQVAPVLGPGESASIKLPVKSARSYRVLVPVEGRAAWGCC